MAYYLAQGPTNKRSAPCVIEPCGAYDRNRANFLELRKDEVRRILLPRSPVNSPFGFASHGEDDFPSSVPFCQIPYGLRSLGERVGPVDDRCELAGFDELLEQDQVLAVLPRNERAQLLVHEPGQYRRPKL